jgi:hypothetical protein
METCIERKINFAHSAHTQQGDDLILADPVAGPQCAAYLTPYILYVTSDLGFVILDRGLLKKMRGVVVGAQ